MSLACRAVIGKQIAARNLRVRISLLLWAEDAPAACVRATIASVSDQIYPHFELRVVASARLAMELQHGLRPDGRIQVKPASSFSAAELNAAVRDSSGEFFGLLRPGDHLPALALFFVADALATDDADLAYGDDASLDRRGELSEPFFKPRWDPELILGRDYFNNGLGIYRRRLAVNCGGFRKNLEEAGAWDLLLRCVETVPPNRIRHIPRVLCQRRNDSPIPGHEACVSAVTDHIARIGEAADIVPHPRLPGMCKVRFRLGGARPLVSIIIPTRDRRDLLEPCVRTLLERTTYRRFELIIVDNRSTDASTLRYLAQLQASGAARVLSYDQPFNWSAINNFAVRYAQGDVVALLNNDIEILTGSWLEDMAALAVRPNVGAVGAMLLYPDHTVQHAGIVLGLTGIAGHPHRTAPCDAPGYHGRLQLLHGSTAVTGACLVVQKSHYLEVGGMDEDLAVAYNDVDFCLKLREKGYRNIWTPDAVLLHKESATRGYEDDAVKKARLAREGERILKKWTRWIADDPCYNPNLSLRSDDFTVAWPPRLEDPCAA